MKVVFARWDVIRIFITLLVSLSTGTKQRATISMANYRIQILSPLDYHEVLVLSNEPITTMQQFLLIVNISKPYMHAQLTWF